MESKTIVDAKGLFLLCALRKGGVYAENIEEYSWTYRHFSYFIEERKKIDVFGVPKRGGYYSDLSNLKIKAKNQFPSVIKMRLFIHFSTDLGFVLNEHDEDMTWYGPELKDEEWIYKGVFRLQEPLTEKEEFILKHYC